VTFRVTFNEAVNGVDATDFSLTTTGTLAGTSIGTVTPVSGSVYDVAVNTGTGDGTIRLNLIDNDSIADTAGNKLGGTGTGNGNFTTGATYTIDRTNPTTTITSNPSNPSNSSSATFNFTTNDPTAGGVSSGVNRAECKLDAGAYATCTSPVTYPSLADGNHAFSVRAVDNAGNTGAAVSYTWLVDTTPPTSSVTFPAPSTTYNAATWNAGCTTLTGDACGTAADPAPASGVAAVHIALKNSAGNYWTGTGSTFAGSTPIWVAVTSGTTAWNRLLPFSTFPVAGSYTIYSRATDVAGNTQAQGLGNTFTVTNVSGGVYTFEGFFSPIDNTLLNLANAGQTVPVKYRITLNGVAVSDPNSFVALTSRQVDCGTLATLAPDAIETYSTNSGLQYNGDGNWHFNWQTLKAYSGQCRVMTLTLNDGSTHDADFKFK
jgi:hypothetical protein